LVDCTNDLLRAAVYSAIPRSARRALHARAVRWTTGDRRLVHHASAADRPDDELATELGRAADEARAAHRYDLAASHRLRARAVSDDPLLRVRLLLEALIDRVASQRLSAADELAASAELASAELLPPSALRSLALGLLAREAGHVSAARTLLQAAVDRARADGDTVLASGPGSRQRYYTCASTTANRRWRRSLGDPDGAADPEVAQDAHHTGIALWLTGDSAAALALLHDVQLSATGGSSESDLLGARGMINLYAGHLVEALADFDRAVDLAHLWRSYVHAQTLRSAGGGTPRVTTASDSVSGLGCRSGRSRWPAPAVAHE
jgi:hypothetical protein